MLRYQIDTKMDSKQNKILQLTQIINKSNSIAKLIILKYSCTRPCEGTKRQGNWLNHQILQ